MKLQFERLRELHRRVTAPAADSKMPLPLDAAFLVAVATEIPTLRSYPVTTSLSLYNCGVHNAKLISIESQTPGVRVISHTSAEMLPAYTSLEGAFRCELMFSPLELSPAARSAELIVRWRNLVLLKTEVTAISVKYSREAGNELELGFAMNEIVFDDLWVDDLRVFNVKSESVKIANLHIETGTAKGVYTMVRQEGGFAAAVVIPRDSEAHYRFDLDGSFFTDERVLETTHVSGVDTACTPLPPALPLHKRVRLQNTGSVTAEISISVSERWIECGSTKCVLEPGAWHELTVGVLASSLAAGRYIGLLRVAASSRGAPGKVWELAVEARVMAAGPLCRNQPAYKLGEVYFGDERSRTITVTNPGNAVLELEGTSDDGFVSVARHQIGAGKDSELPLNFNFRRVRPMNGAGESKLILTTNSWVTSRQRVEIPLSYDLVALRTIPEVVDFGVLSGAEAHSYALSAFLGAGSDPIADLEIDDAPKWVSLRRDSASGLYSLLISGDGLAAEFAERIVNPGDGHRVEEVLMVREKGHGATGVLTVKGIFAHPRIHTRNLKFGKVTQAKHLPLSVTNSGLGNLVVQRVEIDVPWLQVTGSSNASSPLLVTASRSRFLGHMEGSILIHTNDPREPVAAVPVKVNFGG